MAVLTLGLYALWWHRVVHRELCAFLGRADRERTTWAFYVGCHLFIWVLVVGWVADSVAVFYGESGVTSSETVRADAAGVVVSAVFLVGLEAVFLFVKHVRRQIEALEEAKARLGVPMRTDARRFFGLYFAGPALQPVAYWFLQEDYNEVQEHVPKAAKPQGAPTTRPFY